MKKSDLVVFGILTFAFTFSIATYTFKRVWLSLTIAIAFSVAYCCIVLLARKRARFEKKEDFERNLLLSGKPRSNELIKSLYENAQEITPELLLLDDTLVLNAVKYGGIGEEDIASLYRKSLETKANKAIVYMRKIDKNALTLARSLPLKIDFFDLKKLYGKLKENNLLNYVEDAPKARPKLKDVLSGIKGVPPKYFLFTAIACALSSVFLPMKIYYLIVAAINAAFGIVVIIWNYKSQT
ncbi:MAG: hypothetical protein IJS93_02850 [Clostridia bacterium]|nr:hypothetical protein [Clostridia bacterium]